MDEPACAAAAPSARAAPLSAVRLGLFGGSFDPPHQAHLALARAALAQLGLDRLLWLPAGRPWQKARELAPDADRLAMLRLLVAGQPRFAIDDRELHRAGPSYTIDTLRELRAERPRARLFLVVGQDQLAGLPSWRHWTELLEAATLAVAGRAGEHVAPPPEVAARAPRLERLEMPPMAVSSTAIRAHLAAGGTARELAPAMVSPEVAGYIDSRRLYRTPVPDPDASPDAPARS
jgi:nicotinate-nucleotide adenylyltransferase